MLTRKTILLTLLFLVSFGLTAQTDTLFSDFLRLFPGKQIGPEYQSKILRIKGPFTEQRSQHEKRTAKRIIQQNDNFILLSVNYNCGAGGICQGVDIYSFTPTGELIAQVVYSEDFGDCGFMNSIEPVIFEGNQLVTTSRKWKGDCTEDLTDSEDYRVNSYEIKSDGSIDLTREHAINPEREYFNISTELLNKKSIATLNKDELATMRNEIFASYGYQFQSEKWANYFGQFNWYKPTRESVAEQELNPIERLNLQLIQEAENKK
ncbi:YARHG domain-containing protein [Ekhidna sp.]|uniref:YARHG domain-containing protein n=1 Tax=Ekhidna sp. TaxID=2608089 RepID=UPI0032993F8E